VASIGEIAVGSVRLGVGVLRGVEVRVGEAVGVDSSAVTSTASLRILESSTGVRGDVALAGGAITGGSSRTPRRL